MSLKLKKLEDVAEVIVGQIMTRVSTDNETDKGIKNVKVLVPKSISGGVIVKEDLGEANLSKGIDNDKYTKAGDVVIKLSTPYDAAYVTEEFEEIAIPSFCATIRVKDNDVNAKYLSAFLNSSYIRELLISKVIGSARPMIKITDLRAIEIPDINKNDMEDIGEAFFLSGMKKVTLQEMIKNEAKIMDNIVLKSIKGGMMNE